MRRCRTGRSNPRRTSAPPKEFEHRVINAPTLAQHGFAAQADAVECRFRAVVMAARGFRDDNSQVGSFASCARCCIRSNFGTRREDLITHSDA